MLAPSLPEAAADPRNPTASQLRAAHATVARAHRRVDDLQVRAEAAAEFYNGAMARAHKATVISEMAAGAAIASMAHAHRAHDAAAAAHLQAQQARAEAELRKVQQQEAKAEVAAAQLELEHFAAAAYRTGGQLTMVAQLLDAQNPFDLARGHDLINNVSVFQQQTIDKLAAAQQLASERARQALVAETAAQAVHVHALTVLTAAYNAEDIVRAKSRAAKAAAEHAAAAVAGAVRAKRRAQSLVAQAEQALGSARATAASLERAAVAARRAARMVRVPRANSNAAQTAIRWAFREIGTPYSWGGGNQNGPTRGFAQGANTTGFDCSGLTLFVYGKAGIALDHFTGNQWQQSPRVSNYSDLQPGDLMFFALDTNDALTIHHVSIYIGHNMMIEAPHTGDVVKVSSARRSDFIGGTRPSG